jgi:hypothetical protein
MFGTHLVPVAIELLGDQHRHRRQHALAEFELAHDDRDALVFADPDERGRRIDPGGRRGRFLCPRQPAAQKTRLSQPDAQHQAAAGHSGRLQELPAAHRYGASGRQRGLQRVHVSTNVDSRVHVQAPHAASVRAASLIAARMRP